MTVARVTCERLLSLSEVAGRLGRTERTVWTWRVSRGMPCYLVGRSPLFDWGQVVGWLEVVSSRARAGDAGGALGREQETDLKEGSAPKKGAGKAKPKNGKGRK